MMIGTSDEGGTVDFTVRYEPAPDEVARALHQGLKRQLTAVYRTLPSVLVVAGIVCILADAVIMGAGMVVAAVAAPFAATRTLRRIARRQLTYMCMPTTIRVTSDGYECRADQYTTTMQWSMFRQIVTTPEFWLFFINKQFAAFLPKQAFDSAQQAELDAFFTARQNAGAL
ncbi:YcxB family protein [Nonomuraea basaltis]|uniref:YcxB family protein n=1 Tax=Nonomuraea basaltis TaxID=2495887 RepID=UPI00110C6147|nr:YcxB family protein [Nonomuraea basaltis]TMR93028.1 YcxB family protein [Nonomuraea basaltis]